MAKKYIVREGFVLFLALINAKGEAYERTHQEGEVVELDDDEAAKHAHKLEFASEKDRAAALAAEKTAAIATAAASNPVELVQALVTALAQSQGVAPAPAPATAPTA